MYKAMLARVKRATVGEPCSTCWMPAPISCQPRVASSAKSRNEPAIPAAGPVSEAARSSENSGGTASWAARRPAASTGAPLKGVLAGRPLAIGGQAILAAVTSAATDGSALCSARETARKSSRSSREAAGVAVWPPQPPSAMAAASSAAAARQPIVCDRRWPRGAVLRAVFVGRPGTCLGAEQVDREHQRFVRRDRRRRAFGAVREFGRYDQLSTPTDLHAGHAFFPPGDDLSLA